jgi:hypothetical protein
MTKKGAMRRRDALVELSNKLCRALLTYPDAHVVRERSSEPICNVGWG